MMSMPSWARHGMLAPKVWPNLRRILPSAFDPSYILSTKSTVGFHPMCGGWFGSYHVVNEQHKFDK
jgi:NADH:ubiquinone oxidoreductase subunit B-like Fe-S oxidoreductase